MKVDLRKGVRGVLYQSVIDSIAAEIAVLDRQGTIVMTNDSWDRFARENQARGIIKAGVGVNYLEVCRTASGESSEGAREVLAGLQEVLSGNNRDFAFEYACHSPTVRRWFQLRANGLKRPARGAVLLHIDITARKDLEARLREHEERFRVALQNSPVVVFNQDCELRYTWINSAVLGWADQDYLGRTDLEILGEADGQRLTAIKRAVLESGVGKRVETTVTFRGEVHYFDLNVTPMRGEAGAIQGITCAATDITAMKHAAAEREKLVEELANAQRQLSERNLELEGLNKEKTHSLGIAAHDLRNSLSAIIINSEVLMQDLSIPLSEQRAALKSIHSTSEFMLELLDNVLELSVIETGRQRFSPELTDVRSFVEKIIALSRPIADRKQTRIEARYSEWLSSVVLDRPKMSQVLLNLIGNAIKFSPNGANIQITVDQERTKVRISVRDNGPGIPADELGSIFSPFYRSERSASIQRGAGLGLAICKRIVERHGGSIWAENAIAGGAVFQLTLPLNVLAAHNL
jgi:PAS domain S-box-containing protein